MFVSFLETGTILQDLRYPEILVRDSRKKENTKDEIEKMSFLSVLQRI
jgi:hypothetical protein